MKNLRLILLIAISITFHNCQNKILTDGINGKVKKVIHINNPSGKGNVQYKKISKYIDTCFFIKLTNKNNQYIGEISKLLIANDTIFISDDFTKSIFIFDIKGNIINTINNTGRGPYEYNSIGDFTVDWSEKNILINDVSLKKYFKYDFKGNFISANIMKTYGGNISYLDKDRFALYNNFNGLSEDDMHNVFVTDFKGEKLKKYFPYHKSMMSDVLVSKRDYFWNSNTRDISLIRFYDNIVYKFNRDSICPKYFLDFGKFNIPKGEIISLENQERYAHTISHFFETEKFISFNYMFGDKNVLLFYDKQSSKIVYPRGSQWVYEPFLYYSFFTNYVIGCYNDYFIAAIPSTFVTSFIEKFPNDLTSESDREKFSRLPEIEKLKDLSEMDNPVLVFYKLKSF